VGQVLKQGLVVLGLPIKVLVAVLVIVLNQVLFFVAEAVVVAQVR
jgi:hypothetical protein